MKKMAMAAVLALGASAMLAGCGGTKTVGDAPVSSITFSTWQAEEPGYKDFWAEAKTRFEAAHPGVTLEIQQTAFKDYQQSITTRLAANQAPDVIELVSRFFPVLADKGFLAPLDSEIAKTDIAKTYSAGQDLMKWKGVYQGVLVQNYGYVMYYDDAMLKKAGIAVPTTWGEFLAAAKALTKDGVFGVAMDTKQDPNIVLELSWPAVGTGVPYVKNGAYNVTSPEMIKLADQVRELAKYAPQGISSEQKRQYFVDGKAALMFDGPFVGKVLDAAPEARRAQMKVTAMPFPTAPGSLSSSVHLPASATGAKKDLGWQFIQMLTTKEMQDLFVEKVGTPAPREGAGAASAAKNPRLQVFSKVTAGAVDVVPDVPQIRIGYAAFTDAVGNSVSELLSTDKSTTDIMSRLQSTLEAKIPLK